MPFRINKYRNKRTEYHGHVFASKHEAAIYQQIELLKMAGEIKEIELQKSFEILVNGHKICKYIADFVAYDRHGTRRVIDAKGVKTAVYKLKQKLMLAVWGIEIEEM